MRILARCGKPFLIGTNDTRGRFDQSLTIWISCGHGLFGFDAGGPGNCLKALWMVTERQDCDYLW
jgi:hypothetical protein